MNCPRGVHVDELQPFRVGTTVVDDVTIVDVTGYLDLATSPLLRNAAQNALAAGTHRMILDFQNVGFVDSTGLGVVVALHKRLPGSLALVTRNPTVLRVLKLTALDTVIELYTSTAEAIDALRVPRPPIDLSGLEQRPATDVEHQPLF